MSTSIRIIVEDVVVAAELFDTPCAEGSPTCFP